MAAETLHLSYLESLATKLDALQISEGENKSFTKTIEYCLFFINKSILANSKKYTLHNDLPQSDVKPPVEAEDLREDLGNMTEGILEKVKDDTINSNTAADLTQTLSDIRSSHHDFIRLLSDNSSYVTTDEGTVTLAVIRFINRITTNLENQKI